MMRVYVINSADQLQALYALRPESNETLNNLARVWRAQGRRDRQIFTPATIATIEFVSYAHKRAVVVRKAYGKRDIVSENLPYNKALAYSRDNLDAMEGKINEPENDT